MPCACTPIAHGHPASTPDDAHAKVKSTGEGGGNRSPEEHGGHGHG